MPENDTLVFNQNYLRSLQYDEYYVDFNKRFYIEKEDKDGKQN